MQRQSMRVMLASESPRVRYFLRALVEAEDRAVIVAQAENATKALTLARNLRPDVAIVDFYLPHTVGLDNMPLSRIGGLDTAQAISEEIPKIRVILLTRPDVPFLPELSLSSDVSAFLSREVMGVNIPFTLRELFYEAETPSALVFASVDTRLRAALRQKMAELGDKAVSFGGLGIVGGLGLMLTVIFAGAGIFLAAAGAVTMLLGLAGKLAAKLWQSSPTRGGAR